MTSRFPPTTMSAGKPSRRLMGSLACVLPVVALALEWGWTPAAPPTAAIPGRAHAGWSVSVCGADRLPPEVPGAVLPPWVHLAEESAKWLRLREPCARPVVRGPDEALTIWQVGPWTLEHGVSLDPTAPPPADPSLLSRLDQMTVRILPADGDPRVCDPPQLGRAWCGPDPWNWVGPTRLPVRGVETECLWAHPTAEGVLAIGWDVEGPVQFHLRHALGDAAADGGGPVDVAILVDGEERTRRVHRPRPGWQSQRVQLPDAGPHYVEVHVFAADAGRRHICLDGELTPGAARAPVRPIRGRSLQEASRTDDPGGGQTAEGSAGATDGDGSGGPAMDEAEGR